MNIEKNIVVPGHPALDEGLAVKPFKQIHLHSTANANATIDGEAAYLSTNWPNGYYTHLVGQGRVMQVAAVNGGAYDVGGDWNWEAYAAIEFSEKVASQSEFDKSYKLYVELARALAKEAGVTDFTLDTSDTAGIKTHNYASKTGHGSDHTDPLAFLAKWGVSYDKLKSDIKNGFGSTPATTTTTTTTKPATSVSKSDVDKFRSTGVVKWNRKNFKANVVEKKNGIWQLISYELAANGKKSYTWLNNGVPLSVVTRTNNKDQSHFNSGDTFRFDKDEMPIVAYDNASNGIKVRPAGNGSLDFWVDATVALNA